MWYVALGWHAIELAQTFAILEFYIWFRFRQHHRSRHVILHQSPTFYPNRTTLCRKKCRFSRWGISAIMDFRGLIIGSLKSPCATSYRSSLDTVALNCFVFENIAVLNVGVKIQDGGSAVFLRCDETIDSTWNDLQRSLKVIANGTIQLATY